MQNVEPCKLQLVQGCMDMGYSIVLLQYISCYVSPRKLQSCFVAALSCGDACLQDAVKQYDAVFSWLLCLKRVALLMRNLWLEFASFQASAQRSRHKHVKSSEATGTSMEDVFDQRLRILQLFRHEAAHLTTALQAYVHGQLLGDCWGQLQIHIKASFSEL